MVVFEYNGVKYRTVNSIDLEYENGQPFLGSKRDLCRKYLHLRGIQTGDENTYQLISRIEKNREVSEIDKIDCIKFLNDFVYDIDCLEELNAYTNDPTVFEILKIDQMEIRHSNFLAWLLDPREKHGLGDKFIKKMMLEALQRSVLTENNDINPINIEVGDFSDTIIYREKNTEKKKKIDILAVSENNHIVFAIENKIKSGEHDEQLNEYLSYINSSYSGYDKVLVYLTPEGYESSDPEKWVNMDYKFIVDTIDGMIKNNNENGKMMMFINDYIKTVRRHIVGDDEIREICKKIYLKHRDALDLIYEYKPDFRNELSEYLIDYLEENAQRFDITVLKNNCNKTYVRFVPNGLKDELIGKCNGWVSDQYLLLYEIPVADGRLKLTIGPSEKYCELRKTIYDAAQKNWPLIR